MTKLGLFGILCISFMTGGFASGITVKLTGSRIQDVTFKASADSPAGDASAPFIEIREYWRSDTIYDYRGFMKIDLSSVPVGSIITQATLSLWYIDAYGGSNVNQLKVGYTIDEFDPAAMTYQTYDGVNTWTDGDGAGVDGYYDVNPHLLGSIVVNPSESNRYVNFSSSELAAYIQAQIGANRSAYLNLAIDESGGFWQRFYSVDCGDPSKYPCLIIKYIPPTVLGDATLDGMVDVGDLGILAANYGKSEMGWNEGDFNGDGTVDVGDLGILAANYGYNSASADFSKDYASVFDQSDLSSNENKASSESEKSAETEPTNSLCSSAGLLLTSGLCLLVWALAGIGNLKN